MATPFCAWHTADISLDDELLFSKGFEQSCSASTAGVARAPTQSVPKYYNLDSILAEEDLSDVEEPTPTAPSFPSSRCVAPPPFKIGGWSDPEFTVRKPKKVHSMTDRNSLHHQIVQWTVSDFRKATQRIVDQSRHAREVESRTSFRKRRLMGRKNKK